MAKLRGCEFLISAARPNWQVLFLALLGNSLQNERNNTFDLVAFVSSPSYHPLGTELSTLWMDLMDTLEPLARKTLKLRDHRLETIYGTVTVLCYSGTRAGLIQSTLTFESVDAICMHV